MLTPIMILFGISAVLMALNINTLIRNLQRDSVERAWQRRHRINCRRRRRQESQQRARIAATRVLWPATRYEMEG